MSKTNNKPAYMTLLESKGIHARHFFKFSDEPQCYSITRNYNIINLDGDIVPLTENDIWERYENLIHLTKKEYEEAQEQHWDASRAKRGEPTNAELRPIIQLFVEEYTQKHDGNGWYFICTYSEETIRRILIGATDIILAENKSDQKKWQKQFDKMFQDVVLARVNYKPMLKQAR